MPTPLIRTLASLPIALTLLPLVRTGRGWVRIWDFPRLQIAALAAIGGAAMWRSSRTPVDRALKAALGACLLYQLKKVYRYTPLHPKQVLDAVDSKPERQITILVSNVFMGNRESSRIHDVVRQANADVMCFLEADTWWEQELRPLEKDYPYTNKCPLGNTYGMLLYSRLELVQTETRFVVEPDIPSMRSVIRLRSGDEVLLYCLHPRPPLPGSPSYGRDAELVLVGQEVEKHQKPSIIAGDLNDVAWSYTTTLFQRISQTLDPRIGRGLYNTFHAKYPLLRYPLDHVFHSSEFTLVNLAKLDCAGSDHFPICIRLAYTPKISELQTPPEATPEDHEEAREIIEDYHENSQADS